MLGNDGVGSSILLSSTILFKWLGVFFGGAVFAIPYRKSSLSPQSAISIV